MIGGWWRRVRPDSPYWRDVAWLASGTTVAQALGLLAMPLLTRLYEPQSFGALTVFVQVVALLSVLCTLRYEYAIPLPRDRRSALACTLIVIALAVVGVLFWTMLVWGALPWLRRLAPELSAILWLLAPPTAAIGSVALAFQHLIQRDGHYRQVGAAEVINKAGYFAAAIALAVCNPVHWGLAMATLVGHAARGAYLAKSLIAAECRVSRRRLRAWFRVMLQGLKKHSTLSRSMMASHLLMTGTTLIPTLYIGYAYDAATLGQFGLVVSTTYLPSALIGTAIGNVYFQRAAYAHSVGQPLAALWSETARQLLKVGLPLFVALALTAPFLYPMLFGDRWRIAGDFASVMAISAGLSFVSAPMDRTCIVVGAWRYIPGWHALRLFTTVVVTALSDAMDWSARQYIVALTAQMSSMYLFDFFAERHFARRSNG